MCMRPSTAALAASPLSDCTDAQYAVKLHAMCEGEEKSKDEVWSRRERARRRGRPV